MKKNTTKIFMDGDRYPVSIGSQAMMICTMQILKKYIPDATINTLSFYPEFDHKVYDRYNFNLNISKYSKSFLNSIFEIVEESKKSDIVVGVYGDAFVGKDFLTNIKFLFKLLIVTCSNKPVILFPLSVGWDSKNNAMRPFESKLVKLLTRIAFNRTNSISVRDEISEAFLYEVGVNKSLVHLTPDTAFVLDSCSNKRIEEIFFIEGINNKKPLIGINISQLLNHKSQEINLMPSYTDSMSDIIDFIVSNMEVTVMLIPHEINSSKSELVGDVVNLGGDDITAIKTVFSKVRNKVNVVPIINEYNPIDIKGIIGMCDLFIGARTHSTIAATTMCVPTIAIGYSHKAPGIMRMMGLEKYVCDFKNMTLDELKLKIKDMWINKEKIKNMLLQKMEVLKGAAWNNGEIVRGFLNSGEKIL